MKKNIISVFGFLVILILWWGCRAQITLDESEINEIILGDRTLHLVAVIGGGESKEATLKAPISLAVDVNENIYVVDGQKRGVFIYSPSGDFIRKLDLKTESDSTFSPMFISIDPEGNIFLMDVHTRKKWKRRIHYISTNEEAVTSKELPSYFIEFVKCGNDLFFSTYESNRSKLIVKVPISGSKSLEFGDMNEVNSQLHYFYNQIVLCMDGRDRIILSNIYLPRVRIYSSAGSLVKDFIYEDGIKNKKFAFKFLPPVLLRKEGNVGYGVMKADTYPICYDSAVKGQESIFLLMAVDHTKSDQRALFQFDFSGKLIDKVILPFTSHRIFVDDVGSFYFIGAADGKYILKFKEKKRM